MQASCFTICFSAASAQQKKTLTADQIFKQAPQNAITATPTVSGWVDDGHAVLTRINSGKPVSTLLDVKTGSERPYTKPAVADVYVNEGDVFYKPAAGAEKRLTNTPDKEQNPTLSPDGKKVAYTRGGNLFIFDLATNRLSQLTRDGNGVIMNGFASWVYYEEILGRASQYRAFWWSPDSRRIAWMRFDDSKVPVFPIYNSDGQHGFLENQRYPQPGDPNPQVRTAIADVQSLRTAWAAYDQRVDQYFGKPFWTPDSKSLWMQWMNRDQNDLRIDAVNPDNGQIKKIYEEKQKTWVDW
ncbi:MAG: DPP IV N-terminal domain-containing protein, partial [Mucilaginibacter polytrichastri]|nr:DPP IV N-terminal domain-containing protein [Mucilaginibacter polytrichastri]